MPREGGVTEMMEPIKVGIAEDVEKEIFREEANLRYAIMCLREKLCVALSWTAWAFMEMWLEDDQAIPWGWYKAVEDVI